MEDTIGYREENAKKMLVHVVFFKKYVNGDSGWLTNSPVYQLLDRNDNMTRLKRWCHDNVGPRSVMQYPTNECCWKLDYTIDNQLEWSFKNLEEAMLFKFFVLSLLD